MMKARKIIFLMVGVLWMIGLVACGNEGNQTGTGVEASGFEHAFPLVSWRERIVFMK